MGLEVGVLVELEQVHPPPPVHHLPRARHQGGRGRTEGGREGGRRVGGEGAYLSMQEGDSFVLMCRSVSFVSIYLRVQSVRVRL